MGYLVIIALLLCMFSFIFFLAFLGTGDNLYVCLGFSFILIGAGLIFVVTVMFDNMSCKTTNSYIKDRTEFYLKGDLGRSKYIKDIEFSIEQLEKHKKNPKLCDGSCEYAYENIDKLKNIIPETKLLFIKENKNKEILDQLK